MNGVKILQLLTQYQVQKGKKNDPSPKFIPKIVLKKNDNEKEKVQRQISSGKNIFNIIFFQIFFLFLRNGRIFFFYIL